MNRDEDFMRSALQEARRGLGQTSPNPAVGAVLVIRRRIVARGHHRRAGFPHAEVECLRSFDASVPKNAVLYITLEPCSTTGRTAPCTDLIVKSGVKSVVIGTIDPNPRHQGRAIALLRKNGIKVKAGVLENECIRLNEAFHKWVVTGVPFVIAKCGMSLDGRLTRRPGESRWITSAAARRHARRLRAQVDAILVGAETVRTDNPRLTVRSIRDARQPLRIVTTRSGNIPRRSRLLTDRHADRTIVYRGKSLRTILADLGQKNVTSVLIEGGGDVLGQALDEHLIDRLQCYIAPNLTGGPVMAFAGRGASHAIEAAHLAGLRYEKIGTDICVSGYPKYAERAGSDNLRNF